MMQDYLYDFSVQQNIDDEIKDIIQTAFPNAYLPGSGQSNNYFRARLSDENKHYEKTDYYYKGGTTFFHLTSLSNVLSIINSRAIRLYDLNSSADPLEYGYAAAAMGIKPAYIQGLKARVFTFSFCPFSEINNAYIWKHYGLKSTGAAIVFEIENDPKSWQNYHMSEIKYAVSTRVRKFKRDVQKLENARGIVVDFDPSRLVAFHKRKKFATEKEVRLLTHSPYPSFEESSKYLKMDYRLANKRHPRNRVTTYFELPLWVNDSVISNDDNRPELDRRQNLPVDFFNTRPKIVIKDILIGYNTKLGYEELDRLREVLEETLTVNFGYRADLSFNLFDPSFQRP